MDDGLKQRLIGAIVLIAIAVLFVPLLFERSSERELDLRTQIPAQPVITPEPLQFEAPSREPGIAPIGDLNTPPEADPETSASLSEGQVTATGTGGESGQPDLTQSEVVQTKPETSQSATKTTTSESTTVKPTATKPVANSPSSPAVAVTDNTKPADSASLFPKAWAIQVGSFSEEARAQTMVERLLKADYIAYSRAVKANGKNYYRVFVGPKLDRSAAEAEKARLDKFLGSKTLIVDFET